MKKFLIPLVSVALALGCADVPTGTDGLTPNLGVAGKSGCYTVNFTVDLVPVGPGAFDGTVDGDLVGENHVQFLTEFLVTGVKSRAKADVTWTITGGIIDVDLLPLSFETLANGGLTVDPNDPNVVAIRSTEHGVEGGIKVNLNDFGTFTATGASLEYRGVICP